MQKSSALIAKRFCVLTSSIVAGLIVSAIPRIPISEDISTICAGVMGSYWGSPGATRDATSLSISFITAQTFLMHTLSSSFIQQYSSNPFFFLSNLSVANCSSISV